MPPLHRMPVVYLLAVAVAAAVGFASLFRGGGDAGPVDAATAAVDTPSPVVPDPEPTAEPVPADDGILRTADGLRRKVLVRRLGLTPRLKPDMTSAPTGPDLDYFGLYFLYEEADPGAPGGPTYVRVGPDGGPVGWVPTDAVLEWDTRLMARPTPPEGRPRLVIYRERPCLLDALAGRSCPLHPDGPCPTEGEEPSGSTGGDDGPVLGLPILRSEAIPQPTGPDRVVFEVASLVRDRPPEAPLPAEPPDDLKRLLKRIDIAFVIDTTASMDSFIEAARGLARELADEAARRDVTLRLALVAYRDDDPGFGYVTRIVTRFTDEEGFLRALDRIEAARRGDGTVDEAVLDGLDAALPSPGPGLIGADDHLHWPTGREGDLATKLLVLIGDAPDHTRDLDRAADLARRAREDRITIAAVTIPRDGLSRDEADRYRDQWQTLAEGSYLPRDRAAGFDRPIAPVRPSLADASSLGPTLQAIIDDRVEAARELAALVAAEAEGRLRDYVDARGLTLDQVAPVLVDLHRGEPTPVARPDPTLDGRRAPSVRRGWIAESIDGRDLAIVQMLMTRSELDALIDDLGQFQEAVQGGASDLSDLLRIGTAAAAGESAFLAADRGSQTFAEHLRRRRGLPPAGSDSLLGRSQGDLLRADDLYRAAVADRLAAALSALVERRNAPDWDDPDRTIAGQALVPYSPIDF